MCLRKWRRQKQSLEIQDLNFLILEQFIWLSALSTRLPLILMRKSGRGLPQSKSWRYEYTLEQRWRRNLGASGLDRLGAHTANRSEIELVAVRHLNEPRGGGGGGALVDDGH